MPQQVDIDALIKQFTDYMPESPETLREWIYQYLIPVRLPLKPICDDHNTPMDFIWGSLTGELQDAIVWASRGGGKTLSGAITTFLKTKFLKNYNVRILGGSLKQSEKMYNFIKKFYTNPAHMDLVIGEPYMRNTRLNNGSLLEILTQSQKSVRGTHVQEIDLDELEDFDPDIFEAAMKVPVSMGGHQRAINIFSTMHMPNGIMQNLVNDHEKRGFKLLKWCILDVLERCTKLCTDCILFDDCGGRARHADGFFKIEDAIKIKMQSSEESWQSEMLCKEPNFRSRVWPMFKNSSPYVVRHNELSSKHLRRRFAGIDFGYTNPTVVNFFGEDVFGRVFQIYEIYETGLHIDELPLAIKEAEKVTGKCEVFWCDPSEPGIISLLQSKGVPARGAKNDVIEGLDAVSYYLKLDEKLRTPRLIISDFCSNSIQEYLGYRMRPNSDNPLKEHDHACDATRYAIYSERSSISRLKSTPLQSEKRRESSSPSLSGNDFMVNSKTIESVRAPW